MADQQEEEDDYMSMAILEPEKPKFETSAQKTARLKREAALRAHPKSKSELAADAATAREATLNTQLDSSSRGFKMLSKLGYKPGTGLGAKDRIDARLEPIGIEVKENRGGIGMDTEKKRKLREEVEGDVKRVKANEEEYRERVAREREEKRNEGLWRGAMAVLEGLEGEEGAEGGEEVGSREGDADERHASAIGVGGKKKATASKPLPAVNILYRSLVRHRLQKERDRRMRYDLNQSLSRNADYVDDTEKDDESGGMELIDDAELEDEELDELEALDPGVRLEKVLTHLRENHQYCFWCKYHYPDEQMEGCPGPMEDDHD